MEGLFFLTIIVAIVIGPKYKKFRDSNYQEASGNSFLKTLFDKGNYGEYLTFINLKKLDGYQRLMTNVYIPKKDGSTTEIDLLLITETGLFVFESKNYSGWIFGDEKSKNWMQSLPNGVKNQFFNPIWQNKAHINALKVKVGIDDDRLYKSYIIFSERCTLKKINVISDDVKVMKRTQLDQTIRDDMSNSDKRLTPLQIDHIYARLRKYSCVDDVIKKVHIDQVRRKIGRKA